MATKKTNPEKGLRTVQINFAGKQRTLKYSHSARGNFEADANQVLRAQGALKDGMIFADSLMMGWLGNAKILSLALRYALIGEADPVQDIDAAIDSFIEDGGKEVELVRDIITAYRYATDPSSVASLQRSWQISEERQKFLTEAENKAMDSLEKTIADAKAAQTLGTSPTEKPS